MGASKRKRGERDWREKWPDGVPPVDFELTPEDEKQIAELTQDNWRQFLFGSISLGACWLIANYVGPTGVGWVDEVVEYVLGIGIIGVAVIYPFSWFMVWAAKLAAKSQWRTARKAYLERDEARSVRMLEEGHNPHIIFQDGMGEP